MKRTISFLVSGILMITLLSALICPAAGQDGIVAGNPILPGRVPDGGLQKKPLPDGRLSAGKLLVASDGIRDPRFSQTVILLISYDRGGSVGLMMNRPTEAKLSRLFPEIHGLQKRADNVFIGGPVGMDQLFILIRSAAPPEKSLRVFDDIYVSTSMTLLKSVAEGGKAGQKVRFYAGYAGWAAGQLEREIARGDWRILRADSETVFSGDPERIWQDLIRRSSAIQVKHGIPGAEPCISCSTLLPDVRFVSR